MPLRNDLIKILSQKKNQFWILLGYVVFMLTSVYYFSAYWATHELMNRFEASDIAAINHKIPHSMLVHVIPKTHSGQHWQGAGHRYLQQIEPRLYTDIDHAAWLAIQAQVLGNNKSHHYYVHYFNRYRLDLGSDRDQIRFEFERTNFIRWHITRVCYPNPQPDWTVNRCPSSKR